MRQAASTLARPAERGFLVFGPPSRVQVTGGEHGGLNESQLSDLLEEIRRLTGRQGVVKGVLDALEKERAAVKTPYWPGERIGHADIAVACVLRFVSEAHPALFDARYPALKAHSERCEALPPFQEIVQPLAPPSGD